MCIMPKVGYIDKLVHFSIRGESTYYNPRTFLNKTYIIHMCMMPKVGYIDMFNVSYSNLILSLPFFFRRCYLVGQYHCHYCWLRWQIARHQSWPSGRISLAVRRRCFSRSVCRHALGLHGQIGYRQRHHAHCGSDWGPQSQFTIVVYNIAIVLTLLNIVNVV